jgi:hypothetical protein
MPRFLARSDDAQNVMNGTLDGRMKKADVLRCNAGKFFRPEPADAFFVTFACII